MYVKFRYSETHKKHKVIQDLGDYYILDSCPYNWSADCRVAVKKAAVDIIPDEPLYRIGQRFKVGLQESIHILAKVEEHKICLIGLSDGNRWSNPVEASNTYKVTAAELHEAAVGSEITLCV